MENSRDVEDYLQSMLDLSNPEHRRFVETLLNRLGHAVEKVSPPLKSKAQMGFTGQQEKTQEGVSNNKQQPKKKVKQINLFSKEGQAKETIILPGQHKYNFLILSFTSFKLLF